MKNIILFVSIAILASSCASLYNTPAQPTVFLEKRDGIAAQIGIGSNIATNFVSASATKAITSEVCLNASASLGVMGNYASKDNSFKGAKKSTTFAVNVGWNTRKVTAYPMQLWFGVNGGLTGDSYALAPWDEAISKDVIQGVADTNYRFEKLSGNYFGTRIALNHIILSNYENDVKIKARKKTKFDIVGTAFLNSINYNYSNAIAIKSASNIALGYGTTLRVYNNKWILGLHLDNFTPVKSLFDEALGNKNPSPSFTAFPVSIPTISYTLFMGRQQKR